MPSTHTHTTAPCLHLLTPHQSHTQHVTPNPPQNTQTPTHLDDKGVVLYLALMNVSQHLTYRKHSAAPRGSLTTKGAVQVHRLRVRARVCVCLGKEGGEQARQQQRQWRAAAAATAVVTGAGGAVELGPKRNMSDNTHNIQTGFETHVLNPLPKKNTVVTQVTTHSLDRQLAVSTPVSAVLSALC